VKSHGNQILTDSQEAILVGVLEAFSLKHTPLSKTLFLKMVKTEYNLPADWLGKHWYKGFLDRHKDKLQQGVVKAIKEERVAPSVLTDTKKFISIADKYLTEYHFSDKVIINADETRLTIKGNVFINEYIESTKKEKLTHKGPNSSQSASVVVFEAANGQVILSVYILPAIFKEDNMSNISISLYHMQYVKRGDWERFYMFTDTGYLDTESWKVIIKYYNSLTQRLWPGVHNLLLLDKLSIHMQADLVKQCLENGVHTLFFPANTSHFIQPLDNVMFTNFKKVFYKEVADWMSKSVLHHKKLITALIAVAPVAELKAFTPTVIKSSFSNTGIYPWNSKLILQHATLNNVEEKESVKNSTLSVADEARKAAMLVLEETMPEKKVKQLKVRVTKNQLYTSQDLIDWDEKRQLEVKQVQEEKEQKKRKRDEKKQQREEQQTLKREEREEKRLKRIEKKVEVLKKKEHKKVVNTCRVCAVVWKGSKKWMGCEWCQEWWLCQDCFRTTNEMVEHEKLCQQL
jgi:rubrerythrin